MSDQEFRDEVDCFLDKISGRKADDRATMLAAFKDFLDGLATAPPGGMLSD
jgi:hypothetical protein